jgi:GLPGLI family protein
MFRWNEILLISILNPKFIQTMFRKLLIIVTALFIAGILPGEAQVAQGVITYELSIDMHRSIPSDREDMKAMIPQFRKTEYQLFFNQEERLYKPVEDEGPVQQQGRGPGGGRMIMRTPRTETHISMSNNIRTVLAEMMGRNYIIVDTVEIAPWRIGEEFMDIEGFRCQMAWYTDTITKEEITAWFTVGIQPFIGPDRFTNLPGTIMALDINNGERVWVVRKVVVRNVNAAEIRKPSRGEVITRKKYNELVEQQRERMRQGGFRF